MGDQDAANPAKSKHTQFFTAEVLPQGVIIMPEKRMLLAALCRAYQDHFDWRSRLDKANNKPKKQNGPKMGFQLERDLEALSQWFASDDDGPWSFIWICQNCEGEGNYLVNKFRKALTEPYQTSFKALLFNQPIRDRKKK